MATSGTTGVTRISNADMLDHAIRRCGLSPSSLTPEVVEASLRSLFMLAVHMASRGLNLWCVKKNLMGLREFQAIYLLPAGTLSVMNVLYAIPSIASGTDTTDANNFTTQLSEATKIVRIGFKLNAVPAGVVNIQHSDDGVTWVTHRQLAISELPAADEWMWLDTSPFPTATYFRLNSPVALSVSAFSLCSAVSERPMAPFNRDDYSNLMTKQNSGQPSTNYFFEKLLEPQVTLWPVPNNNFDHLSFYGHSQIEDVGSLQQELAVPMRWYETFLTHLSFRLSMEIPGVDPGRITMLSGQADKFAIEAEADETDGSPIYFAPAIRHYTR